MQVTLPGLRPQALALSPDGKLLVVSGKTHELVVLDPVTGIVRQQRPPAGRAGGRAQPRGRRPTNILEPDEKGQLSYTGLVFSPDGRRLYMSNVNGSIKVFAVEPDGDGRHRRARSLLPPAGAPRREEEIPSGLALAGDGRRLYVCGNLSNRLVELDAATGAVLRTFDVGVAPFDVVLAGGKAYVSNWGGRRPRPGDLTGPAGQGTEVRVDPLTPHRQRGLGQRRRPGRGNPKAEVLVQLHASALALSPDRRYLVCANAASDNLSVIDTADRRGRRDDLGQAEPGRPLRRLAERPRLRPRRARRSTSPTARRTRSRVIKFSAAHSAVPAHRAHPGRLVPRRARLSTPARKTLSSPTSRAHAVEPAPYKPTGAPGFNSHQYHGSVSIIPVPRQEGAAGALRRRLRQLPHASGSPRPCRSRAPASRPGPCPRGSASRASSSTWSTSSRRTGPTTRSSATSAAGNGDPRPVHLRREGDAQPAQDGPRVRPPRQHLLQRHPQRRRPPVVDDGLRHRLPREVLRRLAAELSRRHGPGRDRRPGLRAERASSGTTPWPTASRSGTSASSPCRTAAGRTRAARASRSGRTTGTSTSTAAARSGSAAVPAIETVRAVLADRHPRLEHGGPRRLAGPLYRQPDRRVGEGRAHAPAHPHLPARRPHQRHDEGSPTPEACVADNDLAFGRIVEAFSHSSFWKETVIFGIEDDPQNGWDHVSGYRTTAYCASPYTKRGAVVSTQYNTTSLLRTIEQILGLPPMNQFDATATPMFDCFTETPDFTPFDAVPNIIPLDTMNPPKEQDRRRAAAAPRRPVGAAEFPADRRLPRGHAQPHPLARRQRPRRPLPRLGRDPRPRR